MSDYVPRRWPFPEALKGNALWRVSEAYPHDYEPAHTDVTNHRLSVPVGSDAVSRNTRLHEMGHAAWTPEIEPDAAARAWGVGIGAINHAEDMRVNTLLQARSGLDIGPCCRDKVLSDVAKVARIVGGDIARSLMGRVFASSYNTQTYAKTVEILSPIDQIMKQKHPLSVQDIVEKAYQELSKDTPSSELTWSGTQRAAVILNSIIKDNDGHNGLRLARFTKIGGDMETSSTVTWGRMIVEEAPLTRFVNVRVKRSRGNIKPQSYGDSILFPERWCVGGKLFGQRHMVSGGTTLIDCSGSMEWEEEGLHSLIRANPLGTIALYSGDGDYGVLRVIARRSKRSNESFWDAPSGGQNVIDGPALKWLEQQQAPRIWVSDMGVSGIDDVSGRHLTKECERIVKRAEITRVENLDDATELFNQFVGKVGRGGCGSPTRRAPKI